MILCIRWPNLQDATNKKVFLLEGKKLVKGSRSYESSQ